MAVSASYAPLTYAWTNTDQAMPVTWPFFDGSLRVVHIDANGAESTRTLGSDYSVSGGTDSDGLPATGTVTMTGSAEGGTIRIERRTPKTQATTWSENDDFPAKVVEAALDRLVLIAQEAVDGGLDWSGAWATATDYAVGDIVSNGGSSYIAIAGHTSSAESEPGTGDDWEDHWALLASGGAVGKDGASSVWHAASGAPDNVRGTNGDMYLDTNSGDVYGPKANGAWGAPIANMKGPGGDGSGDMLKAENLSGLANVATARSNLGLGSAATADSDDFAAASLQIATEGLATGGGDLSANRTINVPKAAAADMRAGTDDAKALTTKAAYDAMAEVPLTDASTIAIDLQNGTDFYLSLGGNRTLGNPTNADKVIGKKGRIRIVHSNRTLAFGSNWEFAGGEAPDLSSGTSKTDILYYDVIAPDRILGVLLPEVS